jgi:uncharacterized repeat protein (TIGR01451 family)
MPPAPRPSVSVTKTGPAELEVGQTARFTIDITNNGKQTLTAVKVEDICDAVLFPESATEGHKFENNHLVWTIERLAAGERTQLEVHCRCLRAAESARNRVIVTSKEGATAEAEAYLKVRAAPGKLSMVVADRHDPIRRGRELTYEIRVSNDGTVPEKQAVVVATVPPGMMPVPIGTSGPRQIRYEIDGRTVRFDPVDEIAPGEKLSYHIRVSTRQTGELTLRAELTSKNQPQALVAEELTEVLP